MTDKDEPEDTCYCKCGAVYRSPSKLKYIDGDFVLLTGKPCPGCGKSKNNCFKISSDPEAFVVSKQEQKQ